MKIKANIRKNYIDIISYLFIVLFTYAAVSKLLDFENFQVQLGQSPLLSAFVGWVSWLIPALELLIAMLLIFKHTRFLALVASYSLMMMFTTYIYTILHYSEFVPCSCGGILEKMSWNQHLIFNLIFCLLVSFAILFHLQELGQQNKVWRAKYKALILFVTSIFAIGIVLFLFLKSEKIIHQENSFIRRYPPHLYNKSAQLNLKYDGYYFVGMVNDTLYLGNYLAPLSIMAVNSNLKIIGDYKIELDNYELPYRSALVRLSPPYFFLTDGTVPCIFKGKISTWKAKQLKAGRTHFSVFEPIDSTIAAIRSRSPKTNESLLGLLSLSNDSSSVSFNDALLQRQIDGIFDCDGMLRYNWENQHLIYIYYYRNQFIVSDKDMQLSYRGNTIDTTKFAKIKIASLSNGDRKMAEPPLMVNKLSSTVGDQLLINSNLRGHFESLKLWKQSTAIDVYNLKTKTYEYSFHVYNLNDKKPQAMYATKDKVYFLFDKVLVAYKINPSVRR